MIQLPNGCRRSEFHVYPNNWKKASAKLSVTWYAQCNFIDPTKLDLYPKGRPIRIKAGVNRIKKVEDRRASLVFLISEMEQYFENGYNPITKAQASILPQSIDVGDLPLSIVLPTTNFITALKFALSKSENVKESKADIASVLKSLEAAARTLNLNTQYIGDIQVKHIKMCLDECHRANPRFSASRYNKAKAYLSGLFKFLIQMGAASGNMALAVSPMRESATRQIYLTDAEVMRIKDHLYKYNRPFYKFMMIFYYSGGRIKELFRLQVKDVDLVNQKYSTIVKKGKERWVDRTIRNIALLYWQEQLKNGKPNDYVFSKDLLPGPQMVNSKQVTRRWMIHVKKPLGITATFYKLKHRNADKTLKALGAKMAAGQAGHTSTKMVEQVYAYNEQLRIHEGLKELDIEL